MSHFLGCSEPMRAVAEEKRVKRLKGANTLMTSTERIAEKREKIERSKEKVGAEQAKINKFNREIEELESLEVKGLIKELNLPLEDIKELIKSISSKRNSTDATEREGE